MRSNITPSLAACFPIVLFTAFASNLANGGSEIAPYLIRLESTKAEMCWATSTPVSTEISVASITEESVFDKSEPALHHCVSVTSLQPGTTYRYKVGNVHEGTFLTPWPDRHARLAVIGHTHGSEVPDQYPEELLAALIERMDPDMILHSGDATWAPEQEQFARYLFRPLRKVISKAPLFLSAGNHDGYGVHYHTLRALFPHQYGGKDGAYYRIDYKHLRLIFLSYQGLRKDDPPQIDWLKRELDSSDREFNIVVWGGSNLSEEDKNKLYAVFDEHRVDLLLGGDGGGVFFAHIGSVPYAYVGTSFAQPHNLFRLDVSDHAIWVQQMNAKGDTVGPSHYVASQREQRILTDLLTQKNVTRNLLSNFKTKLRTLPEDTPSIHLDQFLMQQIISLSDFKTPVSGKVGAHLRLVCNGTNRSLVRILWTLDGEKVLAGRPAHQTSYFYLLDGSHDYRIPLEIPVQSSHITSVLLESSGNACANGLVVEKAALFSRPEDPRVIHGSEPAAPVISALKGRDEDSLPNSQQHPKRRSEASVPPDAREPGLDQDRR